MTESRESAALAYALAAVALWSTAAVAFKTALKDLAPTDLVILASFVSWIGLGAALLVRTVRKDRKDRTVHAAAGPASDSAPAVPPPAGGRRIAAAALLGLLNPAAYYLVLFAAYDRLPAQAAQPLNYTWPLFLALLAAPINRRRPARRDLIAVGISFVGVVFISWRPGGTGALDGLGVALALGSGVLWACYWLVGDRLGMDGALRLFIGFTAACVLLAVLWGFRGFPLPSAPSGWIAACWVGLFEMGITFLLWNAALARTEHPARIGNIVYLGPFVSLVWIRLVLGEEIRPATVAGLAVIVVGILVGRGILFAGRAGEA